MARDSIRCSFCGKRQEQVGRIIAGPNVYICNECIELCSSILHDEMHNGLNAQQLELPDTLPTPQQIKTYMDRYIIGQDDAKVALSVAVYNLSDSRKKEASFADSKLAKLFIMNQICITNFSFLNL